MRIGFILPSSDYLYDPFRGDPHTHFQILTVLEDRFGADVELSLIDLRGVKREDARYHIGECEVYLYSLYTLDYAELVGIVRYLRERFHEAVHVAGGPHAVLYQEDTLRDWDTVLVGDGERIIVQVMEDLIGDRPMRNKYVEEEKVDINAYVYPRRTWLPASAVARKGLMKTKAMPEYWELLGTTVMFSRDCPYRCGFCAIGGNSKPVRYRRPDLIEQEIMYLKGEYDVEGISLLDEIVVPGERDKAVAMLEAIGRCDVKWRGQTRVDRMTKEMARLMRETGCLTMSLGVESAVQECLDIVNKRIKVERSRDTIKMLKEEGIECRVYMMSGMPGEPEDVVERTINFWRETNPDVVTLSLFTVRPGTDCYVRPERYGIKRAAGWQNMMNLQGRYEDETPKLSFEYEKGKGFSQERIIDNFMRLQEKLEEWGMSSAIFAKHEGS